MIEMNQWSTYEDPTLGHVVQSAQYERASLLQRFSN